MDIVHSDSDEVQVGYIRKSSSAWKGSEKSKSLCSQIPHIIASLTKRLALCFSDAPAYLCFVSNTALSCTYQNGDPPGHAMFHGPHVRMLSRHSAIPRSYLGVVD